MRSYTEDAQAEVSLRITVSGGSPCIQVADNGYGMRPEEIKHLLTAITAVPVRREAGRNRSGPGDCKSIIELHGGTISAAGFPGAGTVFSIEFPVS